MNKIIIICGPTASGKSALSLDIAKKIDGEIINADSLQIYKDIPILSSSPSQSDKQSITHYLYNFLDANIVYSVANWIDEAISSINKIREKGKTPIIIGGTGMYITNLINGIREIDSIPLNIKKETANKTLTELYEELCKIDSNSPKYLKENDTSRIIRSYNIYKAHNITPTEYRNLPNKTFFPIEDFIIFNLLPNREKLYQKCNQRFNLMLEQGALQEIENLYKQNITMGNPIYKAIGAKYLLQYLKKELSLEDTISLSQKETRNYAKRQYSWFRNQLPESAKQHQAESAKELYEEFIKNYA